MYSISDAVVSYTPGSGYTATVPGCSVKIRWGKEFLAEMQAKQQALAADSKAEHTEAPPRETLTKDDITALAAKYNPGKMSQEEYDAFLEELVDRGVLSEKELGRLGYNGVVVCPVIFDGTEFLGGSSSWAAVKDLPGQNPFNLYHSLSDAGGDVLAWAKVQSILNHSASSPELLDFKKGNQSAFQAMLDVLEAIQSERK